MKRVFVIAVVAVACAAAGCKKKAKPKASPPPAGAVRNDPGSIKPEPGSGGAAAEGVRRISVEVTDQGFVPASIPAHVGEKLTLVFTRTTTSPCGGEVVLKSSGEKKELPLNEPVELAVVADKAGSVDFACGMDMMQGSIVVQ